MWGSDLMEFLEPIKELPVKTDEMLAHLDHIEALLMDIAKDIHRIASE